MFLNSLLFPVARRKLFIIAGACVLSLIFLSWNLWRSIHSLTDEISIDLEPQRSENHPPTWDWLKEWENGLPQHNLHADLTNGTLGRYVKFSNQAQQLGWNNILSEL